jgi:hypothetical protein
MVNFKPRPLYPRGKSPQYLFDKRLAGPQNRFGRRGGEKNLSHRDSNSDLSVVQLAASCYID